MVSLNADLELWSLSDLEAEGDIVGPNCCWHIDCWWP